MRIFIAIDIPDEVKERIHEIYKEINGVKGKFVEKENLHITLRFIGSVQPNELENIKETINEILYSKFRISLAGVGLFNNRILWIGIKKGFQDIINLHNLIDNKLKKLGYSPDMRFHPHVTILRIKQILSKNSFLNFIEKFSNKEFGEFLVEEFKIKQSILRPEGPVYIDVYKVNLR